MFSHIALQTDLNQIILIKSKVPAPDMFYLLKNNNSRNDQNNGNCVTTSPFLMNAAPAVFSFIPFNTNTGLKDDK